MSKSPNEAQAIGPTPTEGCDCIGCTGCTGMAATKRFIRVAVAEAHGTQPATDERLSFWLMSLEVVIAELCARGVQIGLVAEIVQHAWNDEVDAREEAAKKAGPIATMQTKGSA